VGSSESLLDYAELSVERYAKFWPPEYRTPQKLLKALHNEVDAVVLPCIADLNDRAKAARNALNDFTQYFLTSNELIADSIMQRFGNTKEVSKELIAEAESLKHQLGLVPVLSPEHLRLVKALELKTVELDISSQRMKDTSDRLNELIDRTTSLIPDLADTQKHIDKFETDF
jgi:hypothetical protein